MEPASSPDRISRWIVRSFAQARFFSVSLLVHVVILLVAGSAVIIQNREPLPDFEATCGPLVGETLDTGPKEPITEEVKLDVPKPEVAAPSAGAMNAIASAALNSSFSINTTGAAGIALGKALGAGTADVAKGIANTIGNGGMGRVGGKSMVKFFGKTAEVQAVVFVVDISGSMITGGKSAKTYDDLEDEVKRAIKGLDPSTKFGLVAFAGEAFLYYEDLVPASSNEKTRAINWLRKQSPVEGMKARDEADKKKHHGTRADKGLEAAFKLGADTIFFVSDGEPSGTTAPEVLKLVTSWQKNRPKPASVNAVAYLADSGQKFMGDLAKQNAGTFREINPKDARKN